MFYEEKSLVGLTPGLVNVKSVRLSIANQSSIFLVNNHYPNNKIHPTRNPNIPDHPRNKNPARHFQPRLTFDANICLNGRP